MLARDRRSATPPWNKGVGNPIRRLGILLPCLLLFCGCSLINVDDKAVDRLAEKLAPILPAPNVTGPQPEKIIDWYDLGALALMGLGGIAHRYYFHKRRSAPTVPNDPSR